MKLLKRVGVVSAARITGVLTAIFGWILGIVRAFIGGALYVALYNLVAGLVGGDRDRTRVAPRPHTQSGSR